MPIRRTRAIRANFVNPTPTAPAWAGAFSYTFQENIAFSLDLDTLVSGLPEPDIILITEGYERDASLDSGIGAGDWHGGDATDTHYYILNNSDNTVIKYTFANVEVNAENIGLTSGFWRGVVVTDDYVYGLNNGAKALQAWTHGNSRAASADISLTSGLVYFGVTKTATHFVLLDRNNNELLFWTRAGVRDSTLDFSLTSGNWGTVFADATHFYVGDDTTDFLRAWQHDGTRDNSRDIDLTGITNVLPNGGFYGNGSVFIVDNANDSIFGWKANGGFPAGMDFDNATHVFGGTPSGEIGVFNSSFDAVNTEGTAQADFTWMVQAPPTWLSTLVVDYTVTVGDAFSVNLNNFVRAFPAANITNIGTLPHGVFLGSDGIVAGTFTTDGTFTLTFRATNTLGTADTPTITFTVASGSTLETGLIDGKVGLIDGKVGGLS